jgi:hypothetical protein
MKKGYLVTYYCISLIFFLLVIGLFAFRTREIYRDNTREIQASFETLRVSALSTYLAEGGYTSDYFRARMRTELAKEPRLLLLSLTGAENDTLYLLARNRQLLEPSSPAADGAPAAAPLSRFLETDLEIPFAPGIDPGLLFRVRFQLLSRQDIYPVLKDIFYITLAYVLVSGILLLLIATGRDSAAAAGRPEPADRRAAAQPPQVQAPPPQVQAQPPQVQEPPAPRTGFFSPRSGLGWQELLENRLDFELERSASFDQDLVLVCLALDPGRGSGAPPDIYRRIAARISETFPFKDLCFEDGKDAYAVLLPDKELDQALAEVQRFQSAVASAPVPATLSVGLSARAGRLLSASRLLKEAHAALAQARNTGTNQIVAFRADPEKYRRVAAGPSRAH